MKSHLFRISLVIGFCFLGLHTVRAQDVSPEDAVKRMKVADGFEVKLVASEPLIRQPVTMSFDDRGRLWVLQYLQYPNPAGLKPVSVDVYLRTKYDRVPEPPPQGPRGADRITILEDTDGDGRFDKAKDFVTGLNLASGMALGHGGVFVVQPPYLLFYADKNGDDVPDGEPEVLLKGFGMEDAHAFANSLQWGPDGWLYGAHGSTSYANIRGIEFVQGIWRYHPLSKRFELFSEGGGNTWGLDFDRQGNAIAGTNFGGRAMLHQLQGAYYVKNFVKHGELKNPHAYGYFEHVPYKGFKGGHVTCGGIVYQGGLFSAGDSLVPKLELGNEGGSENAGGGEVYIGSNPLSNFIGWHRMKKAGSTYKAEHGGILIEGNDPWFRPIDCFTGPDGAVYIADWYDKRIAHHDPRDTWDRRNGRIYRLQPKGYNVTSQQSVRDTVQKIAGRKITPPVSLAKLSSKELVKLLRHNNNWYRRQARRLLAERRDKSVVPLLRSMVQKNKGQLALESLWALYVSGGFNDRLAEKFLKHPTEEVRTWTVRLLGDDNKVTAREQRIMVEMAKSDPSPLVRSQLACSARRIPGKDAMPVVHELLRRDEDLKDTYMPLLLWWAIEQHAISARAEVMKLLRSPADWKRPLVQKYIIERIGRRYMAEGKQADYQTCARLLENAPDDTALQHLIGGMEKALQGRHRKDVPQPLQKPLASLRRRQPKSLLLLRFAMRLGSADAYKQAMQKVATAKTPEGDRVSLLRTLGELQHETSLPLLLDIFQKGKSTRLRQAALGALQGYRDKRVSKAVLSAYTKLPGNVRSQARSLLISRETSALQLLESIDRKQIVAKELTLDQVRQMSQFKNDRIKKLIEKNYGKIAPATADDKLGRIRWYRIVLSRGKGNAARGWPVFKKTCATCHTLFGEGNKIGPDLTTADRKNRNFLLANIVDPSAMQRLEYANYLVLTKDGETLTGVMKEANAETVTLVNEKNEKTVIPRARIEELLPSQTSLMPEKILEPLKDQEICDLFAYLQSKQPPAGVQTQQQGTKAPKKKGKLLTVCLVSGSLEYNSDKSLKKLQEYLESHYNIRCTWAKRKAKDDLPGLENLDKCDVAIFFTRRMTIKGDQLERIKKYSKAGKPIVALRTASHGFQNWLAFDKVVLGGNYHNHYPNGPKCQVHIVEKARNHPILKGVQPFSSVASLYKNTPIAKDTTLLLTGSIPGHSEPLAWTRVHNGGRVFYTSLGHLRDFDNDHFVRMIVNALYWTAKRERPR